MKKLLYLFVAISVFACKNEMGNNNNVADMSVSGNVIADTIGYDVVVKNNDSADVWTEKNLKRFNRESFVKDILEAIEAGKVEAFDFFTNEKLAPGKIKEIEKENGKPLVVGKLQFSEKWAFDKVNFKMTKQVHSIVLGYEVYDNEGAVRGYKPLCKVYFK